MPLESLQPIKARRKQPKAIEALTRMARELGPDAKLPTVQELATALGITIATLDQCLRKLESQDIIVRRHGSGTYVSPRINQKNVGLVFGRNIFSPGAPSFYGLLLEKCQSRASIHNENFSFFLDVLSTTTNGDSPPVHRDLVSALSQQALDGLIVAGRNSPEQERWLRSQNIPVVTIGGVSTGPGLVGVDYRSLTQKMADAFSAEGCRRVGVIARVNTHLEWFGESARALGLTVAPKWMHGLMHTRQFTADDHEQMAYDAVTRIFSGDDGDQNQPDGLGITDDIMARGACRALRDLGLAPGRDIIVMSHANKGLNVLREWRDSLYLFEIDPHEIVETTFHYLEQLMNENPLPKETHFVQPVFVKP